MIQNCIFVIPFLKTLFREKNFFIFVHTFQWTLSKLFRSRFSSRKSQSQQKLVKKITHFTIQFCSKHLTHIMELNTLDTENNIIPKPCQKIFSLSSLFKQTCFCLVSEKTFALHHFLTPKNYIIEAL